jgi:hypothetical protein
MLDFCFNRRWMRSAFVAVLVAFGMGFLPSALRAGTIDVNVTQNAPNLFTYTYTVSGFDLLANQDIDIQFDQTIYSMLSNGVADSDFNLVLLQPNNPPGSAGDYSALALVDNPSLAGPFSVQVSFLNGVVNPPASQPYLLEQFSNGTYQSTFGNGSISIVPEPSSAVLVLLGCAAGALCFLRLRSAKAA